MENKIMTTTNVGTLEATKDDVLGWMFRCNQTEGKEEATYYALAQWDTPSLKIAKVALPSDETHPTVREIREAISAELKRRA